MIPLFWQIAAIKELIKGKEIDLEELETRADQAQIQKVRFQWVSDRKNQRLFPLCCIDVCFVDVSTTKYWGRSCEYLQCRMRLHAGLLLEMLCEEKLSFFF